MESTSIGNKAKVVEPSSDELKQMKEDRKLKQKLDPNYLRDSPR